jgi:hypothetical protein
MNRKPTRVKLLGYALGSTAILVFGCADDGLGKRYPVTGTVTYQGTAVAKGNIFFVPDDKQKGRAATGTISNGKYSLTTLSNNDGAFPGDYKVRVVVVETDNSKILANTPSGAAGRQDDVIKAAQAAKKLIPSKYQIETTSGLTGKVEEKSNVIDFPLTN